MKGVFPYQAFCAGTSDFCSALAALVGPVQNIFSLPCTFSIPLSPSPSKLGRQQCWIACLLLQYASLVFTMAVQSCNIFKNIRDAGAVCLVLVISVHACKWSFLNNLYYFLVLLQSFANLSVCRSKEILHSGIFFLQMQLLLLLAAFQVFFFSIRGRFFNLKVLNSSLGPVPTFSTLLLCLCRIAKQGKETGQAIKRQSLHKQEPCGNS